jgi:HK97 gp10 family phage protein
MSGISITIDGLDEWKDLVDPARFTKEMDSAVQRAAEMLRDETKRMPPVSAATTGYETPGIPVDHGRLRQSIAKRRLGLMAAEVFTSTNYAGFVHDGTSRMPARPYFRWVWEDFEGEQLTEVIVQTAIDRVLNP